MMKWILAAVVVVGAAMFFLLQRDSVKTAYVNGLPEYNALPNREFIIQRDCYIFKFKDRNTSFPLIGDHQVVPALPAEVTAASVGADLPGVRILGLVKVGSLLRLVSVRRDENRSGTHITFELLFLDERERDYPRVDAEMILDHAPEKTGQPPVFLELYMAPRDRK